MFTPMRSARPARQFGAGLILLALWMQVLAPMAALRTAAASRAADALIHAVICGQDTGTDIAADLPAPSQPNCEPCPFCRCTAAAPPSVQPETAVRRLAWRPIAWPIPPPMRMQAPPRSTARARAPPHTV